MQLFYLTIRKIKAQIQDNILFSNSLNLILASGITAGFGFLFWVIIAHIFASETVGYATTMLSVANLLSLLGLAGFDTIFVRYLPTSKNKNEYINSGLIVAGAISALIAALFCLLIPMLSPRLQFINNNIGNIIIFVLTTVFMTWNTLTNAILIAYRRTSFVLLIDLLFSLLKISLPFIFYSNGAITIFTIVGIAQITNVTLSIAVLIKYFKYLPSLKINLNVFKEIFRFGTTSYVSNILNLLPDSVLPIIVVNYLGAISAAYFYIAFAIANLLYTIVFSTNQVLLAETSSDEKNFKKHARQGLIFSAGLITPAILFILIFCPFLLNIFGHNYSKGAVDTLRILSISGFAVLLYSFLNFIFKHTKNLKGMLLMTSINAIAIISLCFIFIKNFGLIGIGWAWLIGTCMAVISGALYLLKKHYKQDTLNRFTFFFNITT